MTDPNFLYNTKVDEIRFSSDLIMSAAMMVPGLKDYLDTIDHDTIDFVAMKEAMATSGYNEKYLSYTDTYSSMSAAEFSVVPISSQFNQNLTWDAIVLLNMISTGVLNVDDVSYNEYEGKIIKNIKCDRKYAKKWLQSIGNYRR